MTTKRHQVDGTMTVYAQSETHWDPLLLVPEYEDVWFDATGDMTACAQNQDNCATTRRAFDMTTGNLIEVTKPAQYAAGSASSIRTYDARKLFVATETNELGHQTEYAYEYGTGTKLRTSGPNVATCSLTSTCPPSTPTHEEHRIRVDGLGRMIERYETFSDSGDSYQTFLVEKNTYIDSPAASVTHESAIDHDDVTLAVRYSKEQTDLDGHGRPIRTTSYVFGTAPVNAVTSYVYANDGTLAEVHVPDPTQNNASTVSYTYTFDSLGRPTSIRRPDSVTPANRSGVDIMYNGLTRTTTEFVTDPGAHAAQTRTSNDAFGRLAGVEELITLGTWATTKYTYDPADNVEQIVDPEGVTTHLFHDFAGRRTKIVRAGATWEYGYDKNGNLWWKAIPCPENPTTCGANYVSYFDYDNLDRVRHRYLAPLDLSTDDQKLFGTTVEELTYDTGPNAIGRLTAWETFGVGNSNSVNSGSFAYNAQGQPRKIGQVTNAADFSSLTRSFAQSYWISGAVSGTYYGDVVGGNNCEYGSYSLTSYDARGSLANVMLDPCADKGWSPTYIRNSRNVAGLVTKRESDSSIGPNVESVWSYDTLGRVTGQDVHTISGLDPIVRQDLEYFGNDDVKTLVHYLRATPTTFEFTYDYRHQLQDVDVPADPSYFAATYSYGPAGRFTGVYEESVLRPGSDVKPRKVEYHYAGLDPEQVTSLTETNQAAIATYQYDLAGNRTISCEGEISGSVCSGNSLSFVYDGDGRLRRVTKFDASPQEVGSEEYWYDESGRRNLIVKRDENRNKDELIWFIGDTEAHYDSSGSVTRALSHVTLGTPVARFDRSSDAASTLEYQFHGLANHTIAAVDETTGTINASFSYAPFGEVIEATDDGGLSSGIAAHRRRLNDKYVDDISDLSYYGFRYYDKMSMTWTQSDPLYRFAPDAAWTSPRKASLYSFNINNPLRYLDPDGRSTIPMPSMDPEAVRAAALATARVLAQAGPYGAAAAVGLLAAVVVVTYWDDVSAPVRVPSPLGDRATKAAAAAGAAAVAAAAASPILMGDKDRVTPPSWVVTGGLIPAAAEAAQDFATRVLDEKYGSGNWKKGPGSEFSKIVKWVNRVVRVGGAAAVGKEISESTKEDEEQEGSPAPADLNQDGETTDEEESTFMRSIQ